MLTSTKVLALLVPKGQILTQVVLLQDYMDVASDMIISKAVYFLKSGKSKEAKATLEYFEKVNSQVYFALLALLAQRYKY